MSLAMDSYSIPVAVLGLARLRDFDMNTFGLFTFSVKFERNCEFDLFCKFKVKMTRRSKVMKELKNSLKLSDLVVVQKVVKKFK